MTTLREAAQQALEALEYYRSGEDYQPTPASEAITALRAALAEPEPEPVQEMEREPANAHDKVYSEFELADAYQKGWNDAMFRRSLGPHIIKEGDMTRDDIIRMAREAGFEEGYGNHLFPPGDYKEEVVPVTDEIIRFAALVAAAEREVCARMVDHILKEGGGTYGKAIRARGEQEQPR